MTKLKHIVAETSSLYLMSMNDHDEARGIRARIEGIITKLDRL